MRQTLTLTAVAMGIRTQETVDCVHARGTQRCSLGLLQRSEPRHGVMPALTNAILHSPLISSRGSVINLCCLLLSTGSYNDGSPC